MSSTTERDGPLGAIDAADGTSDAGPQLPDRIDGTEFPKEFMEAVTGVTAGDAVLPDVLERARAAGHMALTAEALLGKEEKETEATDMPGQGTSVRPKIHVDPPTRLDSPYADRLPSPHVEDTRVGRAITEMVTGPGRLSQTISDDRYEHVPGVEDTDFLPPTQGPLIEATADLFASRIGALVDSGDLDAKESLRVVFVASGSGEDAGAFLDRLADKHGDVYGRTTVEVTDKHDLRLEAAQASPVLARHRSVENGGSSVSNHVEFRRRDMTQLDFTGDDDVPPNMVVAATALSALPAHTVLLDDNVYAGNKRAGKCPPRMREMEWAGHILGDRAVVHMNPTGAVEPYPPQVFESSAHLRGLEDPRDLRALSPHFVGRYTEAEDGAARVPGVNDALIPYAGEDVPPKEKGLQFASWGLDDVARTREVFLGPNRNDQLGMLQPYHVAPGVQDFLDGTLGGADDTQHADRKPGMMVVVMDWMRTDPSKKIARGGTQGVRLRYHFGGMVAHNVVEGWDVADGARNRGARVYTTPGQDGAWRVMLIDTDPDLGHVLDAEAAFKAGIQDASKARARQRLFRRQVIGVLKTALDPDMFPEGKARDQYVHDELERLYADLANPGKGPTTQAIQHDRIMLVEVAQNCNTCRQYETAKLFAERALQVASHISLEAYRELAKAEAGLGNTERAISVLREASAIGPENSRIWSDLRDLYRQEGQWGLFVQATMQYINYARGLDSAVITALLLELCQAQEAYSNMVRDSQEPYKQTRGEIHIRGVGVMVLGEEFGPLRFEVDREGPRTISVGVIEAIRAHTMYDTALRAVQLLRKARERPAWEGFERTIADWIDLLRAGLERTRSGSLAEHYPNPDLAREAHIGLLTGNPLLRDEELGDDPHAGLRGDLNAVGEFVAMATVGARQAQPVVTELAEAADRDREQAEQRQVPERDPYITGLWKKFGIRSDDPIDIARQCERQWRMAQTMNARIEVLAVLLGRRVEGTDADTLSPELLTLLMKGGDYAELGIRLGGLNQADEAEVAAPAEPVVAATTEAMPDDPEAAFNELLTIIRETSGDEREQARLRLVGLLARFPDGDARVKAARQRLSNLLF